MVSFASDGGWPLTAVQYSLDGAATWTDAGRLTSPIIISDLPNGVAVSLLVRGVNGLGAGAASAPASATPHTVPGAPVAVRSVSGDGDVEITWTAPTSDGGAPLLEYRASVYADAARSGSPAALCTTSSGTSCSLTGLTLGAGYYAVVEARNSAGWGPESRYYIEATAVQLPAAPTLTAITPGDRRITATFTPGSPGGAEFLRYEYTLDDGLTWVAFTGSSTTAVIGGLTNGVDQGVRVRTVTTAGAGAASNSLSARPYGYPIVPTGITADGRDRSIVVTWAASDPNGGTIASYTATAFTAAAGGTTAATCTTTADLTCTITGLTNGTNYYVSVQVVNTEAMYSMRSDRVLGIPSLLPSAPREVEGEAADRAARLTWQVPSGRGASDLTGYVITCSKDAGAFVSCGTTTGLSIDVSGLDNGSSYLFRIAATNGNGTGPAAEIGPIVPLPAGTAPTFRATAPAEKGFTVELANYDPAAVYTFTAPQGVTVTRSGALLTVTGLAPGASAQITVTVKATAFLAASAVVTGTARAVAVTPGPQADPSKATAASPDASTASRRSLPPRATEIIAAAQVAPPATTAPPPLSKASPPMAQSPGSAPAAEAAFRTVWPFDLVPIAWALAFILLVSMLFFPLAAARRRRRGEQA